MKNAKDLRNEMLDTLQQLKSGKIDIAKARAIAQLSGKVFSGMKLQMDYAKLTGTKVRIDFIVDANDLEDKSEPVAKKIKPAEKTKKITKK